MCNHAVTAARTPAKKGYRARPAAAGSPKGDRGCPISARFFFRLSVSAARRLGFTRFSGSILFTDRERGPCPRIGATAAITPLPLGPRTSADWGRGLHTLRPPRFGLRDAARTWREHCRHEGPRWRKGPGHARRRVRWSACACRFQPGRPSSAGASAPADLSRAQAARPSPLTLKAEQSSHSPLHAEKKTTAQKPRNVSPRDSGYVASISPCSKEVGGPIGSFPRGTHKIWPKAPHFPEFR